MSSAISPWSFPGRSDRPHGRVLSLQAALQRVCNGAATLARRGRQDCTGHRSRRRACGRDSRTWRASSSATGSRWATRCSAPATPTVLSSRSTRSCTRARGRRRSPTCPAPTESSPSTRAATAARTGPRPGGATATSSSSADTLAVMDELGVDRAVLGGLCSSSWRARRVAALPPGPGRRHLRDRPWRARVRPRRTVPPGSVRPLRRRLSTPTRAGRRTTCTTGGGTGRASPSSSSTSSARAALDQAVGGLRRLGDGGRPRVADRAWDGAPLCVTTGPGPRSCWAASSARCSRCTARRTSASRTRGSERSPSSPAAGRRAGGGRPPAAGVASRCVVNRLFREFVDGSRGEQPPRAVDATHWTGRTGAHVSSPIGLGHTRRDLAIAEELRDPAPRRRRSTGSTQSPVATSSQRAGRARAPRRRPSSPARSSTSRLSRRARPARVPGHPPDGRGAGHELHGVRRAGTHRALRRVGGRRGLGRRLLPAREPGAQARAVRAG